MTDGYNQLNLLSDLLDAAKKAGADAADAVVYNAASLSVSCRMGELEKLERAESCADKSVNVQAKIFHKSPHLAVFPFG